jgi:hypothetical protein
MAVLVAAALILGLARVQFLPAVLLWCVTAGTVFVVERLFKHSDLSGKR